ncbi:hypothetical protein MNBD_NITROSPINAE02-1943 [hydrothermal vent metagenome]|uniref:Leucine-binding protein domain-containing protein n=1 Tax=hydrothermal vent metagenome TaxID=652676 RepID=A0A3B1BYC9_9ZZZZ
MTDKRRSSLALVSLLAIALFIGSCSSRAPVKVVKTGPKPVVTERPIIATITPDERDIGFLYKKAEKLYSQGKFQDAAATYIKFIKLATPGSRIADNAYFKIGMSWFELARYRDALYYFSMVVDKFPDSEVHTEALINSGVCHYHLNNYKEAEDIFKIALDRISSPGHKAYIFFYRAKMADSVGDFDRAVDLYIRGDMFADNEKLVNTTRSKVGRILHNFLGEKDLVKITERYKKQWPAQIAYKELINIYKRSGDNSLLEDTETRYLEEFPPPKKVSFFGASDKEDYKPLTPKIGAVLPLSGGGSKAGREILQGIQLAFNTFRELIDEKSIQPIIRDSMSDPDSAENALETLGKNRDTIAVIGPAFSDAFQRSAKVADKYLLPIFSPSATADGLASLSDRLFRNAMTNSLEVKKIVDLAVGKMGHKKFAIIFPNDKYGKDVSALFIREVTKAGGSVVAAEAYETNQTDFGAQIRGIGGFPDDELRRKILNVARRNPGRSSKTINNILQGLNAGSLSTPVIDSYGSWPLTSKNFRPGLLFEYDAIFIPGMYDKVGLILPELAFYNVKGIKKFASKKAHNPKLLSLADKYTEGVIFVDGFYKKSDLTHVKSFVRNYRLAFREEPTLLSAQSYDAARMVLSGLAHGVASRREMTEYLSNLKFFEGVSGMTSMGPDGDSRKSVTYLVVNDGKIVELPRPESASVISADDTAQTDEYRRYE